MKHRPAPVPVPTEEVEQTHVFTWARQAEYRWPELRLLYAVPNGGHRNIIVARKLKAQGVKPGVPDVVLPVARAEHHSLYVEMKRQRGGTVSPEQKEWHSALRAKGNRVEVCKGWQEAAATIATYLDGRPYEWRLGQLVPAVGAVQ